MSIGLNRWLLVPFCYYSLDCAVLLGLGLDAYCVIVLLVSDSFLLILFLLVRISFGELLDIYLVSSLCVAGLRAHVGCLFCLFDCCAWCLLGLLCLFRFCFGWLYVVWLLV